MIWLVRDFIRQLAKEKKMTRNNNSCKTCGAAFGTKEELKQHELEKHSKFECKVCNQMFDSQDALDKHMKNMHPEQIRMPGK